MFYNKNYLFWRILLCVSLGWVQEFLCLQFQRPQGWKLVGSLNTSANPSITYYFWKPDCSPGTLRIGDAMTQSGSPPDLLACVVGRVNGPASRAEKFVLIWKTLNDSLKFYFGFSQGPNSMLGTIVIGTPQTPASGKKRDIDYLLDPELQSYATFPDDCFDSKQFCPNYTRVDIIRPFFIFNPFQLLSFQGSGSLFTIDDLHSPNSPITCLTPFCACDGCLHGKCDQNGACSCDFRWDGPRCDQKANLCEMGRAHCNALVTCTPANNTYGFVCGPCPSPGFLDPPPQGTNCTDVNECEIDIYRNHCLQQGLNCTNLPGSYVCTRCPPQFIEVGEECRPQLCGNGRLDYGEQCDGGRGCIFTNCTCAPLWQPQNSTDCEFKCGNGELDPGEECDSNATDSGCRYGRCECDRNQGYLPNNSVVCAKDPNFDRTELCVLPNKELCEDWDCLWCETYCTDKLACDQPVEPPSLDIQTLSLPWILTLGSSVIVALSALIIVVCFFYRRMKNRSKQSKSNIVTPLIGIRNLIQLNEWKPPPDFVFVPLSKLPIVISKETLDFGNASNQFKVNFQYYDKIVIFHRSSKKRNKQTVNNKESIRSGTMEIPLIEKQSESAEDMKYAIKFEFHPPESHKYSIDFNPKSGIVKKNKEIEIDVTLKMNMTTEVEIKVGLEIPEKKKYSYMSFYVTSEISPIIDMDEVIYDPWKPIGTGGYGTVYRGTYRGQDVAVKVLKIQDLPQKMMDEFEREVDLLSKLRHKNIVQFVGASTVIGRLAILTEFIELGSASSLLFKSNKQLPYALKVKIALDTARALHFLHNNNILHRDIKPDNLLVVSTSLTAPVNVKLTDFGASREITEQISRNFTQVIGTPIYMAPEILEKQAYGKEADVYSFGVLLWAIYTQKEPYSGPEYSQGFEKFVLSGKREEIPSDCPNEYRELIEKCWAHDLKERPSFDVIVFKLEQMWNSLNIDRGISSSGI